MHREFHGRVGGEGEAVGWNKGLDFSCTREMVGRIERQ